MKIRKTKNRPKATKITPREPVPALAPSVQKELDNKKLMQRFEIAFQEKDIEAIMDCLAPGFVWSLPSGDVFRGRKAVRKALEERLYGASAPRFSRSLFRYHGNTVLQFARAEVDGPDGKPRSTRTFDIYKIRDGKIAKKDADWKFFKD